jgi:hypothetical protein
MQSVMERAADTVARHGALVGDGGNHHRRRHASRAPGVLQIPVALEELHGDHGRRLAAVGARMGRDRPDLSVGAVIEGKGPLGVRLDE